MNIYIVRHGKTEYNRDEKMQGWADSPLLQESKDMAVELGKAFKKEGMTFDKVYSSDLFRAKDTADHIVKGLEEDFKVEEIEKLREMNFGEAEALEFNQIWPLVKDEHGYESVEAMYKALSASERCNLVHQTPAFKSAESIEQFYARILSGLHEVVDKQKEGDDILLVVHGMVIIGLLEQLGWVVNVERSFDNLSVSKVKYDGEFEILDINKMYI